MWKRLLTVVLILTFAATSYAVPISTQVPELTLQRERAPAENGCSLAYYNTCSTWLFYWSGYCDVSWASLSQPAKFGTCFDLADCPGDCRHLQDVYWASNSWGPWSMIDVEIYCADEYCCPIGEPLGGIYDYWFPLAGPKWHQFAFGLLPLCVCEDVGAGKFIVMVSLVEDYNNFFSYSDNNLEDVLQGCETDWRCEGTHSFVYRNVLSYCDLYGVPGPLWIPYTTAGCVDPPDFPPGCHAAPGFYAEWLMECYVSCIGPTAAEETSWSEIKTLYR